MRGDEVVPIVGHLEQRDTQERRPRHVEAATAILAQPVGQALRLLGCGNRSPVFFDPRQPGIPDDDLMNVFDATNDEDRPEDRMARDEGFPGPGHRARVQIALEQAIELRHEKARARRGHRVEDHALLERRCRIHVLDTLNP